MGFLFYSEYWPCVLPPGLDTYFKDGVTKKIWEAAFLNRIMWIRLHQNYGLQNLVEIFCLITLIQANKIWKLIWVFSNFVLNFRRIQEKTWIHLLLEIKRKNRHQEIKFWGAKKLLQSLDTRRRKLEKLKHKFTCQ